MKQTSQKDPLQSTKASLEKQKKAIEEQLHKLEKDDPFLDQANNDRSKIDEPATDAVEQESHFRITASIKEASRLLSQIKRALTKITNHNYGSCENCGKPIEAKRLAAMPMATLCLDCEKKREKSNR